MNFKNFVRNNRAKIVIVVVLIVALVLLYMVGMIATGRDISYIRF